MCRHVAMEVDYICMMEEVRAPTLFRVCTENSVEITSAVSMKHLETISFSDLKVAIHSCIKVILIWLSLSITQEVVIQTSFPAVMTAVSRTHSDATVIIPAEIIPIVPWQLASLSE